MTFKKGYDPRRGSFKKNHKIRNTGRTRFKVGHLLGKRFEKGLTPWNKGKKLEAISGANNPAKRQGVRDKIRAKAKGNKNGYKHGLSKTKQYRVTINSKRRASKLGNGGLHTIQQWEELKKSCFYMCLCCKRVEPQVKLEADHIIPLLKGGSDNIENIQPLCRSCNATKHTKTIKYKL